MTMINEINQMQKVYHLHSCTPRMYEHDIPGKMGLVWSCLYMFVTVAYVSRTDGPCTMLFVFWREYLLYNVDKQCHKHPWLGMVYNIYIYIPPIFTYKNGDDWGIVNMMVYALWITKLQSNFRDGTHLWAPSRMHASPLRNFPSLRICPASRLGARNVGYINLVWFPFWKSLVYPLKMLAMNWGMAHFRVV